jgi:hypothetical protein
MSNKSYQQSQRRNNNQQNQQQHRQLQVTPIADLKAYMGGQIVELPPFAEGQPFVARLRRPSILSLITSGKIPNSLVKKASEMFASGSQAFDVSDNESMQDVFKVIDVLCNAAFVEPTYKQLLENGIELTDEQLVAVFSYTQQGVDALSSFRVKS